MRRRTVLAGLAAVASLPVLPAPASAAAKGLAKNSDAQEALNELFAEAGPDACFLLRNVKTGAEAVANGAKLDLPQSPYATFSIWNNLIALETGAIPGINFYMRWDPARQPREDWWPANWMQGHSMESAFCRSVEWYDREVARRIGAERMQEMLTKLGYGNGDISSGLDSFWLNGSLRITPRQQVTMLDRLARGDVPFRPDWVAAIKPLMIDGKGGSWSLYGKAGQGEISDGRVEGWYVGFFERGGDTFAFASFLRGEDTPAFSRRRKSITVEALSVLDML